jgi:hypothetical protein
MHWRLLVQRDPETLITGAFLGVLGRPPLDEEMSASKAILAEGGDIAAFIREIVSSEVHRSNVLAHTAVNAPLDGLMAFGQPILAEAYRGILGRNPDDEGLAVHASSLQQTRDLAAVLGEISRSDEAWARALQERAAEIANELRAALLGVDDHPDASGEQAPSLRSTSDLRGLVESLAKGVGHWRHLARRDAEVLVEAAYTALLQREPDAEERQNQANWLAETGDMVTFLAEIGRSDEHSMRVTESQALKDESSQTGVAVQTPNHEALIVSAFQGLLGREPDAQALAAYSTYLGETGNVAAFLAELGGSVEHRKRVLLRTSARP